VPITTHVDRHKVSGKLILSIGSEDGYVSVMSIEPEDAGWEIFRQQIIKNGADEAIASNQNWEKTIGDIKQKRD